MNNGKPRNARFLGARAIRKNAVILILCALLIAAPISKRSVNASPPQTEPALRLEDLERMALQNNPTVGQAEAAVRAAEGRRVHAGLMPNPIVGYLGEELSARAFDQKSEHYVFTEQEVPLGGKLKKSRDVFAREKAQAQAEAAAQKQRVLNAVKTMYYEALGAQRLVEVRGELAKLASEAVDVTGELFNTGAADQPDVLQRLPHHYHYGCCIYISKTINLSHFEVFEMSNELNWMRRKFLQVSSLLGAGFLLGDAASAQHEHHQAPKTEAPKVDKKNGKAASPERDHQKTSEQVKQPPGGNAPVITPDLPKLEYKMENGVKVFNLTAEVVECELMPKTHMGPARKINAWGYNGSVPGPMIEVNEGDRVRFVFTNKLPEPTTIHWHGLEIPIEMAAQEEKNVSNTVGAASAPAQTGALYACPMHPQVLSDKPGNCPKCGMALLKKQITGVALTDAENKRVPGYPQDMMMIVDDDVAKPETYGLAPGWTASMMGMMTLVRVLPEDKYNDIMARIKAGKIERPQSSPGHKH